MIEQWRDIPGMENIYQASNTGKVRSLPRIVPHSRYGKQRIRGTVLSPVLNSRGYEHVTLTYRGEFHQVSVHRLVALTFWPSRNEGDEVRHLDGNKLNNCAWNLAWGTHSENMRDRLTHGTDPNASKTHCVNGHEFSPDNTRFTKDRHRVCKTCAKEASYRWRNKHIANKKEAA